MSGKQLKQKTAEFSSSTTIHGLAELVNAHSNWLRIIWGMIMFTSACICCWQLYRTIEEYQEWPSSVTYETTTLSQLPIFYVHLLNIIDNEALQSFGLRDAHIDLIFRRFPMAEISWSPTEDVVKAHLQQLNEAQARRGSTNFTEFLTNITYTPERLFRGYGGATPDISFHVNEYGPCFQFSLNNSKPEIPMQQRLLSTVSHATQFVTYALERKYLQGPERGNLAASTPLFISIGEDNHNPNMWVPLTSTVQSILIQPQIRKILNRADKPCSTEYTTQIYCKTLCVLNSMKKADADCEWYIGQTENKTRLCESILDAAPVYQEDIKVWRSQCSHECPPPCESWEYNPIKIYDAPTQLNLGDARDTVTAVLMNSLEVPTLKEKYTYNAITLFCNIGGILSLYLGASVLSFLHLMYFFTCKYRVRDDPKIGLWSSNLGEAENDQEKKLKH